MAGAELERYKTKVQAFVRPIVRVYCDMQLKTETLNYRDAAMHVAQSHGFHEMDWRPIGEDDARAILGSALTVGPEYFTLGTPDARARVLADEFLSMFSRDARFFTNVLPAGHGLGRPMVSCRRVTRFEWDVGVLAADSQHMGLLWFAEGEESAT